ncbi:MAG: hypothetical protein ACI4JE_00260 [Ruminococcus sp.]|nr:hypothetical protein [Oscillospiraceae bacterium]
MNFINFVTASQAAAETPSLFPFPFPTHLGFSVISLLFFLWRFSKEKRPYQLIMAIAIPFSLVIRLSDSRTLFYFVGVVELILLFAAFISSIVFKDKSAEEQSETDDDNDSADTADDAPADSEETSDIPADTSAEDGSGSTEKGDEE